MVILVQQMLFFDHALKRGWAISHNVE